MGKLLAGMEVRVYGFLRKVLSGGLGGRGWNIEFADKYVSNHKNWWGKFESEKKSKVWMTNGISNIIIILAARHVCIYPTIIFSTDTGYVFG